MCGSGEVFCSSSLLIRRHNRARCQADNPLTLPSEIVEPLLCDNPQGHPRCNSYDACNITSASAFGAFARPSSRRARISARCDGTRRLRGAAIGSCTYGLLHRACTYFEPAIQHRPGQGEVGEQCCEPQICGRYIRKAAKQGLPRKGRWYGGLLHMLPSVPSIRIEVPSCLLGELATNAVCKDLAQAAMWKPVASCSKPFHARCRESGDCYFILYG